jgi:hypothetical protein
MGGDRMSGIDVYLFEENLIKAVHKIVFDSKFETFRSAHVVHELGSSRYPGNPDFPFEALSLIDIQEADALAIYEIANSVGLKGSDQNLRRKLMSLIKSRKSPVPLVLYFYKAGEIYRKVDFKLSIKVSDYLEELKYRLAVNDYVCSLPFGEQINIDVDFEDIADSLIKNA